MNYLNILVFISGIVLSSIAVPMILNMLLKSDTVNNNYKNEKIPICMGLLFIFIQIINISVIFLIRGSSNNYILYYLFAFTLIGMVGLLDDLVGDKEIKGLKGHIKSFFKGKLTTGGIKAGIGFFISVFISIILSQNLMEIVINTLLMALFTNLTNLFDLRPGRTIKVFILISTIMLFTSIVKTYDFILYSFYGILIVYFPLDLKAKVMMGDVGSNVMGITLGIFCAYTQNIIMKSVYLIILIIIHIIAERFSFSEIINNNKILKFLDNLGR
ncbi:phospho-N-acetylmuramoyl-pentapeptide-transferase [Schnuerera sp. xch1]|uniref:phospho-N-acetylmuramoyl-pentapeptide- transferase n=1 Tax=Schnuerera sp. xch1 TaxID=2874283 RepID=UPI001CC0E9FF|nr:phospho-N-acetylmuramoyl-pentapeptide-transferase [Schnuerera sp. xch1]MBZ2173767.1 phospho-N-acetylmuramoyl-pentapeptide-transferase [Schnuerera sp. xch1]